MEEKDQAKFYEVVELFVTYALGNIQNESEIPRVDFLFDKKGLELINYVKDHPFEKKGYYIPSISDKDMERVNARDDNCYLIRVHDAKLFFSLLTDIINASLDLEEEYNHRRCNARGRAQSMLRRIWLRMSINDLENVEGFLFDQLMFLKDRSLDSVKQIELPS